MVLLNILLLVACDRNYICQNCLEDNILIFSLVLGPGSNGCEAKTGMCLFEIFTLY